MVSSSSSAEQSGAASENEIRGMISSLADRLVRLGEEDGDGARVVMLAGENRGAVTIASEQLQEIVDTHGTMRDDDAAMGAFANGNYQAVNNSVVVRGRCTVEDPGIHIAICDKGDGGDHDEEEEYENDDEREGKAEDDD